MADPSQATPPPPSPGPGGFLQNPAARLSPAPSHAASPARSRVGASLPRPRRHALRPGSAKEDLVRRYVSERILQISRRFVKKNGIHQPGDTVVGYHSMGELCRDFDVLLDTLWRSGTRGSFFFSILT